MSSWWDGKPGWIFCFVGLGCPVDKFKPNMRLTRVTIAVVLSVIVPVFQVWAWKENVWEKEKGTLLERYTVEQSKPSAEGGGVLSTLTINNVMESDFLSTYNCTAWNSFGPGTMIITLEETGTLFVVKIMD